MMKKLYILVLMILFSSCLYALPQQIIIIRHADKLGQENEGPTLSAKGYIRAVDFAYYYLNNFGFPDYIFAKNPLNEGGKAISYREMQTVAPLADLIEQRNPAHYFQVSHPFIGKEFSKLAKELLNDKKYDGKKILICWNHTYIPDLAHALGVKQDIPNWPDNVFDTVYKITYNEKGVSEFMILDNQYPVRDDLTWENIEALSNG